MATPHRSPYPSLSTGQCESIAVRNLRAQFLGQSPDQQRETLERVQRLLEDERRRQQNQPSYLMKHHEEIYGL